MELAVPYLQVEYVEKVENEEGFTKVISANEPPVHGAGPSQGEVWGDSECPVKHHEPAKQSIMERETTETDSMNPCMHGHDKHPCSNTLALPQLACRPLQPIMLPTFIVGHPWKQWGECCEHHEKHQCGPLAMHFLLSC
jgi:hypothetical protein